MVELHLFKDHLFFFSRNNLQAAVLSVIFFQALLELMSMPSKIMQAY